LRIFVRGKLWLPDGIPGEEIQKLLNVAAQYGVSRQLPKSRDAFAYGGAAIRVLAPDPARPVRLASKSKQSAPQERRITGDENQLWAHVCFAGSGRREGHREIHFHEDPSADLLKVGGIMEAQVQLTMISGGGSSHGSR